MDKYQGAAANARAQVDALQEKYKDIIAPRGSSRDMAPRGKAAAELASTLAQAQKRLNVLHARSTSPWGSPGKGGPAGSATSSQLRGAERELRELTAQLEKAKERGGNVHSPPAKAPPEHLMGLSAANTNHRGYPNPGTRATSNGFAHGWLGEQGLVEGGGVQGVEPKPPLLADLEYARKQLEHTSARPLHMSHAQAPWPSHALRGRSKSSSSNGSTSSTSSRSSTGRAKYEGRGSIGATLHSKRHGRQHPKHGDAALASLLKAKQPSSIVTLQQQLQQLGDTAEKEKRRSPYSMRHESHKPPLQGDAVAQASAKASRMGQELVKGSSRKAAVTDYQPMARAASVMDKYSSSSSSRGDFESGNGFSGLSRPAAASRQAQGKHTSCAPPPHTSKPTHQFHSNPLPPSNHLQPPTLTQPSQYLYHPPPPAHHTAPSSNVPPAHLAANGHHNHRDPPPFTSPPRMRVTPRDSNTQRALHPSVATTTGEHVLLSSPRALAVGKGIGHFRLSDPAESDAQWLRSATAAEHHPLQATAVAVGRGSAMSGVEVPSSSRIGAGANAHVELDVRLQQIREEVEQRIIKGGEGSAGSAGLLVGQNGAGSQPGHLGRWLGAQNGSGGGDLHLSVAGRDGLAEGASHLLQQQQQWEFKQQQEQHGLQQQFLLAENGRLRTQLDEVQALLQEAQHAQQAKPQPVIVPCSQCSSSAAQLQEAHSINVENAAELASLRIALQEARNQGSNHSGQLAELQAALDRQGREAAAAHASLLADMRTIYTAASRRGTGMANGPPDQQEGPDFLSYPHPSALVEALHRRVKQLVTAVEVQDSELRAMEARVQRAHMMSGQSTLEAETQVAEAEATRDEAIRQDQLHQQALREELHTLHKTYEHGVEELQRKLRVSEDSLKRAEMESASQAAQLREYGAALEHKLSRLNEDCMDFKLAKEDAASLRRQVQELRNQVRQNEDSHTELEEVREQLSDLVDQTAQQADHVQVLQGDVRSLRGQLDAKGELLAARTSDLEAMRGDLQATLSQLEQATASKESLKEQLTKQGREAASLRAEAADRTRENIVLHEEVTVAQERAAAAEAAAREVLEAGNSGGLMRQNVALTARVAELQDTFGSVESERIRLVEVLSTDVKNAQARAQDLEAKLHAVTADKDKTHKHAQTMAKDVQSMLAALDQERDRTAVALKEAAAAAQAVAEASRLRTALARMEGTADELRNQLAQTKQQMESMVSVADSNKLREQLKDAEEKLSISAAQVEDLRAAEREYQQAIEQMEAELHNSQISAMQASTTVQALREDLEATCSQRDELASRLDNLEGPQGPLSRVRELETALQRERQTCGSLSQQLATASLECEQIAEELQKKEALVYQLDGTVQILREEVTRLRRQYGEEFV